MLRSCVHIASEQILTTNLIFHQKQVPWSAGLKLLGLDGPRWQHLSGVIRQKALFQKKVLFLLLTLNAAFPLLLTEHISFFRGSDTASVDVLFLSSASQIYIYFLREVLPKSIDVWIVRSSDLQLLVSFLSDIISSYLGGGNIKCALEKEHSYSLRYILLPVYDLFSIFSYVA